MKIRNNWHPNIRSTGEVHRKNQHSIEKTDSNEPFAPVDKTDISDRAKKLQMASKLIQESVEQIKSMPAIREEAVMLAKERVKLGYYDQKEVLDDIAGTISEHLNSEKPFSPDDLASDIISHVSDEGNEVHSKEDLEEIKKNIEVEKYKDPAVIDKVAERILSFLQGIPEDK